MLIDRGRTVFVLDIDGTLLDTGGVGVTPFEESVERLTGLRPILDRDACRGRTDHWIARHLLAQVRDINSTDEDVEMVLEVYVNGLGFGLAKRPAVALGGVVQSLYELSKDSSVDLIIATGNHPKAANLKLASANLHSILPLRSCSISVHEDRVDIVRRAVLMNQGKHDLAVVVGDTIHDYDAARELGLPFIHAFSGNNKLTNVETAFTQIAFPWSHELLLSAASSLRYCS